MFKARNAWPQKKQMPKTVALPLQPAAFPGSLLMLTECETTTKRIQLKGKTTKGEVVTLVIVSQIIQKIKVPIPVIQRAASQEGIFFFTSKRSWLF